MNIYIIINLLTITLMYTIFVLSIINSYFVLLLHCYYFQVFLINLNIKNKLQTIYFFFLSYPICLDIFIKIIMFLFSFILLNFCNSGYYCYAEPLGGKALKYSSFLTSYIKSDLGTSLFETTNKLNKFNEMNVVSAKPLNTSFLYDYKMPVVSDDVLEISKRIPTEMSTNEVGLVYKFHKALYLAQDMVERIKNSNYDLMSEKDIEEINKIITNIKKYIMSYNNYHLGKQTEINQVLKSRGLDGEIILGNSFEKVVKNSPISVPLTAINKHVCLMKKTDELHCIAPITTADKLSIPLSGKTIVFPNISIDRIDFSKVSAGPYVLKYAELHLQNTDCSRKINCEYATHGISNLVINGTDKITKELENDILNIDRMRELGMKKFGNLFYTKRENNIKELNNYCSITLPNIEE